MPIIIFSILLSMHAHAAQANLPSTTYDRLNKAFNLDRSLKSKVVEIGIKNKVIDLTSTEGLNKQQLKIEQGYNVLRKDFNTELEKNFSKAEIAYINQLFSHSLMDRLVKFQNQFITSDDSNAAVLAQLKKDPSIIPPKK